MSQYGEPWKIIEGDPPILNVCSNGPILGNSSSAVLIESERRLPVLERIVACVNFCRDFSTEFLTDKQMVRIEETSAFVDTSLAKLPGFEGLVAVTLKPVVRNSP